MGYQKSNAVRLVYLASLRDGLRVTWPILSGLLMFKVGLGTIVGMVEGWSVWKGIYFAFITGLTIGYGDLVPSRSLTQVLSIIIGFSGILLTGVVAALAVRALQAAAIAQSESEDAAGTKG